MFASLALAASILTSPASAQDWRVVGGHPAAPGEWPDAAAVFFGGTGFGCTGVLIAPDLVLTAGHCDFNISEVVLGTNDLTAGGETIAVIDTYTHPNSWNTYDLSVLVLETPSTVAPRMIAQDCLLDYYLEDGSPVAIVGYGAIDEWATTGTTVLMEAMAPVTDHDCTEMQLGCNNAVSPGGEIIAGGSGIDSCNGDSGGPLYLLTPEGDFLVGITSRGINGSSTLCGDGGIYVRPDAVLEWIETTTGRTLAKPECLPPTNEAPVPTAEPIVVEQTRSEQTTIDPGDPDLADTHTFVVIEAPVHGDVELLESGVARYTAAADYIGEDRFIIEVEDDGIPPMSSAIEVTVAVVQRPEIELGPGGCGCAAPVRPTAIWTVLGLLGALGLRRRR